MKIARRALTADDVEDVLAVISESVEVIDANLVKFADHRARISEATSKLNDLARRLREGQE
jgi:hypothetical protein